MNTNELSSSTTLSHKHATNLSKKILKEILDYRRVPTSSDSCSNSECNICSSLHLPKIISAVKRNQPVVFVLPAFPGKSPNPEKVLGFLPDLAEEISLKFLGELSERVKEYYKPGIKIILCSDGRVFSDVVGMKEDNVTSYQIEIENLIKRMSLFDISTFNLDDYFQDMNFTQMREKLMSRYSIPLKDLKIKVRAGSKSNASFEDTESNRMYCGITRFLVEDSMHTNQLKSRSSIQSESRVRAYEVIRRSNAWSELISKRFPEAIRLSIHPQTCGSKKIGIRLVGDESWITPWHGVAVETKDGYMLLKRKDAENLNTKLIYSSEGRASYYKLNQDKILNISKGL